MPTISDLLRSHLLEMAGVRDRLPDLPDLKQRRWVPEFERLMRNRLIMGAFRYECEDLRQPADKVFDNISSMKKRLDQFMEDGDLEHLVDVANLCMLEFRCSRHPKKHLGHGGDHGHHTEEMK